MGVVLVVSCFVSCVVITAQAQKESVFENEIDKKIESSVLATFSTGSALHCTMKCVGTADCMACNWQEASRTCELLGAHATPVAAPGYTALTRYCKKTAMGAEFLGSLSVTLSGRTCQHWGEDCNPHCDLSAQHLFLGGVFPENYCRNPDTEPNGPWCFTTDPTQRWEYCDVPLC